MPRPRVRAGATGCSPCCGRRFDPAVVAAEMRVIAEELHCTAGMWERIDWTPFDLVASDAYRDAGNAARFEEEVARLARHGKPVAVTEFGCCGYRGAADRGGLGWAIVDRSAEPAVLKGDHVRDEAGQAGYFTELLEVFERRGVDSAFWFTFAGYELPHDPDDPRRDLDLASYGVVRMPAAGTAWEPKEVFGAMARAYGG